MHDIRATDFLFSVVKGSSVSCVEDAWDFYLRKRRNDDNLQ